MKRLTRRFAVCLEPAYVSLQSALYLHGMISQVPALRRVTRAYPASPRRWGQSRFTTCRRVLLRLRGCGPRRPPRHAGEGSRGVPVSHAGALAALSRAAGTRVAEAVQCATGAGHREARAARRRTLVTRRLDALLDRAARSGHDCPPRLLALVMLRQLPGEGGRTGENL
jgi:hypothetical protein